ncbi:probable pantoate--beta-alanine ligase [Sporisorium reilianum SRZ2]|uniref:Pantoate--beta-alanine ligase n=2 Tax=Sporisorium reilianum TaxID=72558 RepID=E6ZV61_SPORE|nr:putative pantoate-beta-alanine ligase [Sporisorium reilianum]CAI59760.1 probable pantoate--beta-alanine ligase [Sporisorium reilianum]CBQ71118.1 probable pantoate--beta-alanine ligase [Sporisorium reilianum SRZ2]
MPSRVVLSVARAVLTQASSSSSACTSRVAASSFRLVVQPRRALASTRSPHRRPLSTTAARHGFRACPTQASSSSMFQSSSDSPVANSPIPIFTTVSDYRAWRAQATKHDKSVGFVATMGALHDGHLKLVKASLEENDCTVVSIFVNPAQFAPTEDLASYPRTVESDISKLASLSFTTPSGQERRVDVAFVPSVKEMYPNGFTQVVADQVGAFIEVKGLSHQMEGGSRPTFFRGVATVVTKLFHIIQPDNTYFGQKDIQQSIVLRRLVSDLVFSHPPSPDHLRVVPTGRDPTDNLALSSRNAYLTPDSRQVAPVLYRALKTGQDVWEQPHWTEATKEQRIRSTLDSARAIVLEQAEQCKRDAKHVNLKLDYISLNHPKTLENLEQGLAEKGANAVDVSQGAILSGAALVSQGDGGKVTRLIDNLLLGFKL